MLTFMTILKLQIPLWVLVVTGFIISFLLTFITIPTIVKISRHKKLFDIPNERTSHSSAVPVLGGLAIFAGITTAIVICTLPADSDMIKFVLGALIVLFFLGLKDDILIVDPKIKLLVQIFASSIVVILGDIRITDMHSTFGIDGISYVPSVLFTIFLFVTLINGFNLIDGVDGLSSGSGILASLALGIWFIITDHYSSAVLSFSLTGTLAAYFIFNVFGKQNKIFMGDTGSMITGLVVSVLIVHFLEFENFVSSDYQFVSTPAIAFGLLILPLFDSLRVFILRILDGHSPFKADRNHVHHLLLELGLSHLKATLILIIINIFFIVIVYSLQFIGNIPLVLLTLLLASFLSYLLNQKVRKRRQRIL